MILYINITYKYFSEEGETMKNKISLLRSLWIIVVVLLIFIARAIPIYITIPFLLIALFAPLYREFQIESDLDERQIQVSHFSSHIAFYIYISLILTVLIVEFLSKKTNPPNLFYLILLTPLTIKLIINIFNSFNAVQAATYIGLFFSTVFLFFNIIAHNIFSFEGIIQASPFIILLFASIFAKKYPTISGIIFALLGITSLILFKSNFDIYLKILMFSILTIPMFFCSYVLLTLKREDLS